MVPLFRKMTQYEHSIECLQDLHDIIRRYNTGIVVHQSLAGPGEKLANRFEVEKREAIIFSMVQVTKKFETGITDVDGTESIWSLLYVGPTRSFTNYNYTLAQPTVKLCGLNTGTTISDLIESYQHHTQAKDLSLKFLMYDQEKHQPDELVKDIIQEKLHKHFFYFEIDIEDDGRDINELVDFIGGACASPARPKRKRKRSKAVPKTLALQKQESIEAEDIVDSPMKSPTETNLKEGEKKIEEPMVEKEIDQDWKDYIDKKSYKERTVFTVGRELDFDITEEDEHGSSGMTLEKAEYLDRLSGIIASKAQAEWENKKVGFEKLQREHEQIEIEIKSKEVLFGDHQIKVKEMIELKGKETEKFIELISDVKEEKQEGLKQIAQLEKEISKLNLNILEVEDEKKRIHVKDEATSVHIEKVENKRRKLEKHIELEMENMKKEGETIQEHIEKLGKNLSENYKKADNLATVSTCRSVSETMPKENSSRVADFLARSIKEKEVDLECPVCFETADIPIFMCLEMHLICNRCRPKVRECPECRLPYTGVAKRHKFAEKTAGELGKLRIELENLTD